METELALLKTQNKNPEQGQGEKTTIRELIVGLMEFGLLDEQSVQQFTSDEGLEREIQYADLKRLIDSDLLQSSELAEFLGKITHYPVKSNCLQKSLQSKHGSLSASFLIENKLFPCCEKNDGGKVDSKTEDEPLLLLVANPFDIVSISSTLTALEQDAVIAVIPVDEMEVLLEQHLSVETNSSGLISERDGKEATSLDMLLDLASGTPVVAIVNELLEQAIDLRATDIHLEPTRKEMSVRYRIDGVLRKMPDRSTEYASAIVSRIKVLAKLDIAEKRKPQDGATRLNIHGNEIDLRIATLPTNHGESVVIRLLERNASLSTLENMGMSDADRAAIKRLLDQPYGMIAVTGPTGSGKTTTLATAISHLNDSSRKIVTIEDPIEYQIDNIAQSQVRTEIGSTFATAIRAFVRQDPDIIMVGEVRDSETAKAAVQAAQTGHLLLTTLHANTAVSAITRLRDLDVESFLLASNLRGVIAQRLVRVLCKHCKKPHQITSEDIHNEPRHTQFHFIEGDKVFRANGCSRCGETGYRGRVPIFEVFEISNEIALAINEEMSALKLLELARDAGMTTLSEDAKRLVCDGITSPEEIFRVTAYL